MVRRAKAQTKPKSAPKVKSNQPASFKANANNKTAKVAVMASAAAATGAASVLRASAKAEVTRPAKVSRAVTALKVASLVNNANPVSLVKRVSHVSRGLKAKHANHVSRGANASPAKIAILAAAKAFQMVRSPHSSAVAAAEAPASN